MGTTAKTTTLTGSQIQTVQQQTSQITQGVSASSAGKFVFFAAFDGTNNDRNNLASSNDTKTTAVGQLWTQYEEGNLTNPSAGGNYYPVPGAPGTL